MSCFLPDAKDADKFPYGREALGMADTFGRLATRGSGPPVPGGFLPWPLVLLPAPPAS